MTEAVLAAFPESEIPLVYQETEWRGIVYEVGILADNRELEVKVTPEGKVVKILGMAGGDEEDEEDDNEEDEADPAPLKYVKFSAKDSELITFEKLVFVKRQTYHSSHFYTDFIDGCSRFGGNICVLDLKTGKVTDLIPGRVKTEAKLKARSPNDDTSGIIKTRSSMQASTNLHFGGTGLFL